MGRPSKGKGGSFVTSATSSPSQDSSKPKGVKTFECPQCGSRVEVHGLGQTLSATCRSCQSIIDIQNENLVLLQKFKKKQTVSPAIDLGARGQLFGNLYEHIGFVVRGTPDQQYQWREYLLFNPRIGFRWLVENDGHWSFVKMTMKIAEGHPSKTVKFEGEPYRLFNEGKAVVFYVMGEFYWKVRVGEQVESKDYVCPPRMLSFEGQPGSEFNWSVAQYLTPQEVSLAFGKSATLPPLHGIGAIQPNPSASAWRHLKFVGIIAICLLSFEQLTLERDSTPLLLTEGEGTYTALVSEPARMSEPFVVSQRKAVVKVSVTADMMNNWLEVDAALIEEGGQRRYETEVGLSYYTGSDSDGYWSEGARFQEAELSGVEPGTYRLHLKASGPKLEELQKAGLSGINYSFKASKTGSGRWPLVASVITLLSFLVFAYFRNLSFESKRWSNSDFGPSG
jgi:hypothetical protein